MVRTGSRIHINTDGMAPLANTTSGAQGSVLGTERAKVQELSTLTAANVAKLQRLGSGYASNLASGSIPGFGSLSLGSFTTLNGINYQFNAHVSYAQYGFSIVIYLGGTATFGLNVPANSEGRTLSGIITGNGGVCEARAINNSSSASALYAASGAFVVAHFSAIAVG